MTKDNECPANSPEVAAALERLAATDLGSCLAAIEPGHRVRGMVTARGIIGTACEFQDRYFNRGEIIQVMLPLNPQPIGE